MVDISPDRLDAIEQFEPTRRGRALEHFVAALFRQDHFSVRQDAGAARPRQTDVFASRTTETYLVECKWQTDKADIGDIDSLRARLRRIDRSVVGLLVSMSGFTSTAVQDVGDHRWQPILLISGEELRLVTRPWGESLLSLLWRKKDALIGDGTVLLDAPPRKRTSKRRVALPPAEGRFINVEGAESPVVECGGRFDPLVFVQDLRDIDWVPAAGHGVTLDLTPGVYDEQEVLDLVDRLADLGWATPEARWSIQQSTRNWHGLGCAAFATELPNWGKRASTPEAHHSEEICYVDHCDGGFYTLTAKLSAESSRLTEFAHLSFQLQGIPLDNGPLLQLCRSVGVHEGLYFRPRADESVTRHRPAKPYADTVQPIHCFVTPSPLPDDRDPDWVTGIVIINPFYDPEHRQPAKRLPEGLNSLRDCEQLVCALHDHHPYRDGRQYTYRLTGFEHAHTSDVTVCRPIVDWDRDDDTAASGDLSGPDRS
ncbi:restriction endonuclease [Actinophytocola sp.]|uniref:restriction endonuclease n=1 Tax=Actinophytocola sp. TaxID=1872138 RepID=UPI00389B2FC2